MRIVFFGSGAFGVPTLSAIVAQHQLLAIVSQPDRRAGRGSKLSPTPVCAWTQQNAPAIPLHRPESINTPEWIDTVRAHEANAWVIIAYGQKLSPALLADRFALNLHASLLPRWRGASPINAAILAGDTVTGNSVITLADRMDAGLILGQSTRPLDPSLTADELHDLLAADGPELVLRVLDEFAHNAIQPVEQDETRVTIAPKLSRTDAWLDFNQPAKAVQRRVHGLSPWPGVTVLIGDIEIKLMRVAVEHTTHTQQQIAPTGTLIDHAQGLVQCLDNTILRLIEVQPVGKRAMPWQAFANGHQCEPGTIILPKHLQP